MMMILQLSTIAANYGPGQGATIPKPARPQDHLRGPRAGPWTEHDEAESPILSIHAD